MDEKADYFEIIKQAQLGGRDDMSRLAEEARGRVFIYIYRVTLDHHLAQDLSQETMLEMLKSLRRLNVESVNSFWSWLYRTALGKIQHHFRYQGSKRIEQRTIFDGWELLNLVPQDRRSGLTLLLQKELSQAVLKAMGQLKVVYRNILTLRCFDEMTYADIAAVTGVSKMQAMLLFFRAKQSLKKQLARNGFKKEQLLPALGLFGAITASSAKPASAVATVSSAAMKVSASAAVIGSMTTKTGIVSGIIAVTALLTVTVPVVLKNPWTEKFHIISEERLDQARFKYPSKVQASYNPDGWKGDARPGHHPKSITLEQHLIGPPAENLFDVVIPEKCWVELCFSSAIVNGPGDDIIIVEQCKRGEQADVFITNCDKKEVYIGKITVPMTGDHEITAFGFDISGLDLPFTPCGVRILTTDSDGAEMNDSLPGFDLVSVRANLSD
jgi:RNA polymerase sigma-70 factor (ECF subfamily)